MAAAGNGRQPEFTGPLSALICSSSFNEKAESVPKGINCIYPFPPAVWRWRWRDSIFFSFLFFLLRLQHDAWRSRKAGSRNKGTGRAGLPPSLSDHPFHPYQFLSHHLFTSLHGHVPIHSTSFFKSNQYNNIRNPGLNIPHLKITLL